MRVRSECAKALLNVNFLTLKHLVDLLESFSNKEVSALMTHVAACDVSAVMSRGLRLGCRKIAAPAARKLNNKGLLRIASCLDAVSVVKEKLEGFVENATSPNLITWLSMVNVSVVC